MKKHLSIITVFVLICFVLSATVTIPAFASDISLINTDDFLLNFNLYASITGLGHILTSENAEITRFSDGVLFKTVLNDCEVLSLDLSSDSEKVMGIHCSWSTLVPGATKYSDDFIYLLIEVLCACGMKTDTVADVFTEIGTQNAFDIGDSGETIVDGIRVSYTVTSYSGVSFLIERA